MHKGRWAFQLVFGVMLLDLGLRKRSITTTLMGDTETGLRWTWRVVGIKVERRPGLLAVGKLKQPIQHFALRSKACRRFRLVSTRHHTAWGKKRERETHHSLTGFFFFLV